MNYIYLARWAGSLTWVLNANARNDHFPFRVVGRMVNGRGADREEPAEAARISVKIFISYAHDDSAHEDRVRGFWRFLRGQGVDAHVDLSAAELRQDWTEWMTRQIRDADYVLVIASPEYKRRAEGDAMPDEGRGVQWEARLIRDRLYADPQAGLRSIVPVVLPGCSASDIPLWIGPVATTHYLVRDYTVTGAEKLLRLLTGQPAEVVPPLGKTPFLPPRPAQPYAPGSLGDAKPRSGWWWWKWYQGLAPRSSTASQVEAAADRLAEGMTDRWRREAAARRIITPAPVTVRWRWAARELTVSRAEAAMLSAVGAGPAPLPDAAAGELLGSGVVTRLYQEVYARLPHGRLVLVGGPGAGKSTAMILLLLAALDRRASAAATERAMLPVPVWLSLGGWDPDHVGLEEWVTSTMKLDYPALRSADYGPDAAGALFRGGKVALFLDGLDEMPEAAQDRALERIAGEGRGLRLVITSRPGEYQRAVRSGPPDNTAVIELRPVRPAAAAAFLLHGQLEPGRQRWQRLVGYLTSNPGSVAAQALDNPLALSLARDAYAGKDPVVLADTGAFPTMGALLGHLMEQILVTAYPDERQRSRAAYWLSWIAHHMGTGRDLPWWGIAASVPAWRLRFLRALTTALVSGSVAALSVGLIADSGADLGERVTAGLWAWLWAGLAFGLFSGLTGKVRFPGAAASARPQWQLRFIRGHSAFLSGFVPAACSLLPIALAVEFVGSSADQIPGIFWSNILLGVESATGGSVLTGLGFGLAAFFASVSRAALPETVRRWKFICVRSLVMFGLTGLTAGIAVGHTAGPQVGFWWGLACGIPSGLASALLAWPIARVMAEAEDTTSASGRSWRSRVSRALSFGSTISLVTGTVLGVTVYLSFASHGFGIIYAIANSIAFGLGYGVIFGILGGLMFGLIARSGPGASGSPQGLVPRWPRPRELARLLVVAVFVPLIPFALIDLWSVPVADSPSATPASTYRSDRRSSVIYGIIGGLGFALLPGFLVGLHRWQDGFAAGLVVAVGVGMCLGLGSGQAPILLLTEVALFRHRRGHGRARFLRILEQAASRQVLRQAGTAYQFRHAALQDHLAAVFRAQIMQADLRKSENR